ncbi:50S ribosomal protein L23 [Patescibacteria group bacterium]
MDISHIIKKPIITEKSIQETQNSKFTFAVDKKANKSQVKKAVEEFFQVDVKKVWLLKYIGKRHKVGRFKRKVNKKPDWKKAIVKLDKGQKIDLFDTEGK